MSLFNTSGKIIFLVVMAICFAMNFATQTAMAQDRIVDICRLKGQETNVLRGFGLVVGLQGTGGGDLATSGAALAEAMARSGMEVSRKSNGDPVLEIYKDYKNFAVVSVTATVPAEGIRQGSHVECRVQTFDGTSSLEGGTLLETALTGGPVLMKTTGRRRGGISGKMPVLAIATGKIKMEGTVTTAGVIGKGAQLQVDFNNPYYEDVVETIQEIDGFGKRVTRKRSERYLNLVLKQGHASFLNATKIAEQINSQINNHQMAGQANGDETFATVIDQVNIRVRFIPAYHNDPAAFARYILYDITVLLQGKNRKVVMNRRTGVITIGEDVYFSPVSVAAGEFKVDVAPFKEFSVDAKEGEANGKMKLKRLVQALNNLQAPPKTIMEVILHLRDGGNLYGDIIEK